jgi:hypothetical protein
VDHRSLKDRGINRIPEPKIGKEAVGMKQRGVVEDPERFKLVRWVKCLNIARPWLRGIEKAGEVPQRGIGKTWLERSMFFATQTRQTVRNAVMDAWTKLIQSRQPGGHDILPKDRGPEMSR